MFARKTRPFFLTSLLLELLYNEHILFENQKTTKLFAY